MIFTKTPFRISLFGGSTDYKSYFEKYGSFLLGFTIDKYCYICLRESPSVFPYKNIISYSQIERVNSHSEIKHNGARGTLEYLKVPYGVELIHLCDLPSQTGIGSSSSFIVGLVNAIKYHHDENISKEELARTAIEIERDYLNESGGWQDQIWGAYGGFNSIEIYQDGSWAVRPMPISDNFITEFVARSALIYTGKARNSFDIAKSHDCETNIEHKHAIRRLAHQAYDAFQDENIEDIGYMLDESWQHKQKISDKIVSPEVADIYNDLRKQGTIIGGKLLGSGGSGFLFCVLSEGEILPPKYQKNNVNFKINWEGSRIIS
jgi:D-glycero-alpha-D-manno-heptose-7-phosphate kinase